MKPNSHLVPSVVPLRKSRAVKTLNAFGCCKFLERIHLSSGFMLEGPRRKFLGSLQALAHKYWWKVQYGTSNHTKKLCCMSLWFAFLNILDEEKCFNTVFCMFHLVQETCFDNKTKTIKKSICSHEEIKQISTIRKIWHYYKTEKKKKLTPTQLKL